MAGGARRHRVDNEAVAVFHQRVTHQDEAGFLARPLAEQPGIGVGGRGVGVVLALLAAEVPLAVAPRGDFSRSGRLVRAVLWAEALGAGPGLQERAVDREMLVRQQTARGRCRATAPRRGTWPPPRRPRAGRGFW